MNFIVTIRSNASNDPVSFGVVGGEILRRFKVFVLASRNQIILEPTASLREPFRWDASGLILMSPRPFTSVLVYKVLEGSSGAKAGLRAGDELIELDGKTVGAQGLDNVWHALQAPNRRHLLKIRRGTEERSVSLVTKLIVH
jgi:predicted metalloprotease with PDZ domain